MLSPAHCRSPAPGHAPYLSSFGFLHLRGIQVAVEQLVMEALGGEGGSGCSARAAQPLPTPGHRRRAPHLQGNSPDDVQGVDDVAKRLAHLPAMSIAHNCMEIDLGAVPREVRP